jgi:hypothetical protein
MPAVTVFPDLAAATLEVVGFDELPTLIRSTFAPSKGELPLLKLARFGPMLSARGSLRHNGNVLAITGIEADYDGERIGFEAAVQTVKDAGIGALLYTSPSYSVERPRWRVLCPTSIELPTSHRGWLLDWLDGLFGGRVFGGESWTLSQAFFFGNCERVELVEGDWIDLLVGSPREDPRGVDKAIEFPPGLDDLIRPTNLSIEQLIATYPKTAARRSEEETRAYYALKAGCSRILAAAEHRSDTLNRELFSIGGMIPLGWIAAEVVINAAVLCAEHIGLIRDYGRDEVMRKIRDSLNDGIARPYQ